MNCSEAREKMELLALGGLCGKERKAVEGHLDHCSACRDRMAEYDFVVEEVRQDAEHAVPDPDWQASARAAIGSEIEEAGGSGSRAWRLGYAAAAAAAAILTVVAWHALSTPSDAHPRSFQALARHVERWNAPGLLARPRSPAAGYVTDGERVYALRRRGSERFVCAMDAESGRHLWRSEVPALGHLATAESTLFCLSPARGDRVRLVALDHATGRVRWEFQGEAGRRLSSPTRPVPTDGGRVCWTIGGTVHVLDISSGSQVWSRRCSDSAPLSPPAVSGSFLLVASPSEALCLGLADGRQKWRQELPDELQGQVRPLLALSGDRAFLVQRDYMRPGRLCSMDLQTREVTWDRQVNRPFNILSREGVVCLRGDRVVAYDAEDGSAVWSHDTQGCSPLTASDGVVHFVDSTGQGHLLGVELASGRIAWRIDGVRSCDAFIRSNGIGYVKTRTGTLHAFRLDSAPKL